LIIDAKARNEEERGEGGGEKGKTKCFRLVFYFY
jgi:hypothetical protein